MNIIYNINLYIYSNEFSLFHETVLYYRENLNLLLDVFSTKKITRLKWIFFLNYIIDNPILKKSYLRDNFFDGRMIQIK